MLTHRSKRVEVRLIPIIAALFLFAHCSAGAQPPLQSTGARITVHGELRHLAVAADGTTYITTRWPSTLVRIARGKSVTVRAVSLDMVDPDAVLVSGELVWVADRLGATRGSDRIVALRNMFVTRQYRLPATGTVRHLGALASDTKGNIWYAAGSINSIGVITRSSGAIHEYRVPSSAEDLVIDSQDRIWLSLGAPSLSILTETGKLERTVPLAETGHIYTPFLSHTRGAVWYAGYDNRIRRTFNAGWVQISNFQRIQCLTNAPLGYPTAVASLPDGSFAIASSDARTITFVNRACRVETRVLPLGVFITDISADPTHPRSLIILDGRSRRLWTVAQ